MKGIYVRQSIVKEDSISLDTQVDYCKRELKEGEKFKVYRDQKSGKDTNRQHFQEMIEDIQSGLVDTVIVYKIDRISRSVYDFGQIMRLFEKYKVEFVSYIEKFDTTTAMGQAMLQIVMVFAELERKTIQLRISDNYYARGKAGRYLGGKPPFGYDKEKIKMDGKKTYQYTENLEQSELVKSLFEMYYNDNDMSYGKMAQWINEDTKYKTTRGNGWSSNTISRIIRNPAFTYATAEVYLYLKDKGCIMNHEVEDFIGKNGLYWYTEGGKERKKNEENPADTYVTIAPHKPFIEAGIWLACQLKADKNQQIKNNGKGTYSFLSGLMKCGYCGLAATVANREKGEHKLTCGGKKRHSCNGVSTSILLEEVENHVGSQLLQHLQEKVANSLSGISENENADNKELNQLNIELIKVNEEIDNLVEAVATAGVTVARHYNAKIEKLDKVRERITKKILSLKVDNKEVLSTEQIQECIDNWDGYDFDRKKEIVQLFIKVVTITDNEIQIIFN